MSGPAKRNLILLATIAGVTLVGVSLFIGAVNRPPVVHGRSLTAWLSDIDSKDQSARLAAERAITSLGDNGVRFLQKTLAKKDFPVLALYRRMGSQLPFWIGRQLYLILKPDQFDLQRKRAADALGVLGAAASPAFPDLVTALDDRSPIVRLAAAEALDRIGKPAIPTLLQGLNTRSQFARIRILNILAHHKNDAREVLPSALELALRAETDQEVTAAVHLLKQFPSETVAALLPKLAAGDEQTRVRAKEILPSIILAVPGWPVRLQDVYRSQSVEVRASIVEALERSGAIRQFKGLFFMLNVVDDPDPGLQERGFQWLRGNLKFEEFDRILKVTQPAHLRDQIRARFLSDSSALRSQVDQAQIKRDTDLGN
ncbi:MAG: HEAT repeat domain-containing protein [Verrucomicrobiae bacterium]|nr:HEAT repeat domain-containing protein [Verrucomicrobiae bacterium]